MVPRKRGVKINSKRGTYNKCNALANQRILDAADNNEDWQAVAKNNGIKLATARRLLINRRVQPSQRGGPKVGRIKITANIMDHIISILENNSQFTIKQIRASIHEHFHILVSNTCIAENLSKHTWTVKKVTNMPVGVNNDINKLSRRTFVTELMVAMANQRTILYQDETNLNLFLQRTCGRAPAGKRARRTLPNSKGPNVHCIGVYAQLGGLKFHERRRGSLKKDSFQAWFTRMLTFIGETVPLNNLTIIIDNAPCHNGIEQYVTQNHANEGIQILRMAPYSAPLSPIEMFWSAFKAVVKRTFAQNTNRLVAPAPPGITQTEHRLQFLENTIDDAIIEANADPQVPIRYYNHVQSKYQSILNLEDLLYGE